MRIVIAGAGIAGLSVAHALAKAGLRPTVVAKDHGATAAGAGIVSAQFWDETLAPYARRSQEIIEQLVPVRRCGMAQIACSQETAQLLDRIENVEHSLPETFKASFAPGFARTIVRATFSPYDFCCDNGELLSALAAGSELVTAEITAIDSGCLATRQREIKADRIVVAMGPASGGGTKRYVSQLAAARTSIEAMFHVLDSGLYMRPDGRRCLVGDGDTEWSVPADPAAVTPAFLNHMSKELSHILSASSKLTGVSAGVIAVTADHRPIVRDEGNTLFIYGFGGDGLALAPAFGEEVARMLIEDC